MKVQKKQNPYKSLIAFIPIVLMLAVVPLIVRAKIVLLDENTAKFWTGNYQIDLFSYSKTRMIMFLTVWMLVNAFFFFSKKDFKNLKDNKWVFYPVIVFVFSLIVSTMLSEHKNIAIWGAPERYEGMIVHLCYIIMFLYTYMTIKTEDDFKYIKYSILFLSSVMAVIGLTQAFGKDILTMDFMRNFIVPSEYRDMLSAVSKEGQQVYLTLQNSNYVGTYAAIIIPFLFMLCISKYEHKYIRIASGILTFLTFFILVKSSSKAGLFAVICIFILIPIIFYKVILNLKKTTIFITIAVILFTTIGVNVATGNKIADNLFKISKNIELLLMENDSVPADSVYGLFIEDIILKKDMINLFTENGELIIKFDDDGNIEFRDYENNLMEVIYDRKGNYDLKNFNSKLSISKPVEINKNKKIFSVQRHGIEIFLIEWSRNQGVYLVDGKLQRYEKIIAPHLGFKGKERLFGRGYIWSRTLPMILKKPIFGYGSDNFFIFFPQYDIPAKYLAYGDFNIITDKPHNIYLLYTINNGFIGLISILVLWVGYILTSIRNELFISRFSLFHSYKVSCILAVVGYMITGLLNDSVPVTAPIFWIILGTGFALNKIVGKAYEG